MVYLSAVLAKSGGHYLHWCPGCDSYHVIYVDKRNPVTGAQWTFNGNVNKPSFTPSINIVGQCHYFITDGRIQFCGDCKHDLKEQTVDLPPLPDHWTTV